MVEVTELHGEVGGKVRLDPETDKVDSTTLVVSFELFRDALIKSCGLVVCAIADEDDSDGLVDWDLFENLLEHHESWDYFGTLASMEENVGIKLVIWDEARLIGEGDCGEVFFRDAFVPESGEPFPAWFHRAGCVYKADDFEGGGHDALGFDGKLLKEGDFVESKLLVLRLDH